MCKITLFWHFCLQISKKCCIFASKFNIVMLQIERNAFKQLHAWKQSSNRKPLLLQGARQIGKTWLMREFGKREFDSVVELNFDEKPELRELFRRTKDTTRLIRELALYTPVSIQPERTLLIFDEIQESEEALNALKYFCENAPQYPIIAAGSLLGVHVRKKSMTVPVGKVQTLHLHPLSFNEFLRVADSQMYDYCASVTPFEPLPEIVLSRLTDVYRQYMVCGGMPEAAIALLEKRGMQTVEQTLGDILQLYQADFSKYATPVEVTRMTALWQSLPSQLAKENRKFIYNVIRSGARAREYEDGLIWLEEAGLIYRIYNVGKPGLPLAAYRDLSAFKAYTLDSGLLRRLAHLSAEVVLSENNPGYQEFRGAMAENMVLQSLVSQYNDVPYYWSSGNKAEIDFLIEHGGHIIPIEVKSSTRISGGSLASYFHKYNPALRIRFSMNNLHFNDGLLSIPLPLADWTHQLVGQIFAESSISIK